MVSLNQRSVLSDGVCQFLVEFCVGVCQHLNLGPELDDRVELLLKFFVEPRLQSAVILSGSIRRHQWQLRDFNRLILVFTQGELLINFLELFVPLLYLLLAPLELALHCLVL